MSVTILLQIFLNGGEKRDRPLDGAAGIDIFPLMTQHPGEKRRTPASLFAPVRNTGKWLRKSLKGAINEPSFVTVILASQRYNSIFLQGDPGIGGGRIAGILGRWSSDFRGGMFFVLLGAVAIRKRPLARERWDN